MKNRYSPLLTLLALVALLLPGVVQLPGIALQSLVHPEARPGGPVSVRVGRHPANPQG